MKILGIGDIHLSEKIGLAGANGREASGERRSLADARRFFAWIEQVCGREQPDLLAIAGDLFDRAKPTPAEYTVAIEVLTALSRRCDVVVIPGNHDLASGADSDALAPLASLSIPGLHIHTKPGRYNFDASSNPALDKLDLYALPYPEPVDSTGEGKEADNGRASRSLSTLLSGLASEARTRRALYPRPSTRRSLLLAHLTFSGSAYVYDQTVPAHDVQAPVEELGDFDLVIAGHLHKRQRIGCDSAWYTGTPDRWTYAQGDEAVGALLFELDEQGALTTRALDYPGARVFLTLDPQQILEETPRAGVFVRCRGEVSDAAVYDKIVAKLRDWSRAGSVARCDVLLNRSTTALAAVDSTASLAEIFEVYNVQRPDAIPPELKARCYERARQLIDALG